MLGAYGGVMLNTAPTGSSRYFENFESTPQMVAGGKLAIDTRKIQLGVGCNVSGISYSRDLKLQGTPTGSEFISYDYATSFVNPYAFVNFKKNLVRSYLYFGFNAGYMNFTSGKDETYYLGTPVYDAYYSANGFSGGLQAGARVKLIDGLGVSAEAGMRYVTTIPGMQLHDAQGQSLGTVNGGTISFPLTLGVDYIF